MSLAWGADSGAVAGGGAASFVALTGEIAARLRAGPPQANDRPWPGEPDALVSALAKEPLREAAVLVPLVLGESGASLLLTRRTSGLRHHSGQIAFPGGKIDPQDSSAAAAALREAEEEIGIEAAQVTVLGYLDAHLSVSRFRVIPVVGAVAAPLRLRVNPAEVEEAFEVPLAFLMNPANHRLANLERDAKTRHFYEMTFGTHRIWGVTAGIIRALAERIGR
ncbi:MAG: CoA pyrophosphatase [Bauldia sp.]